MSERHQIKKRRPSKAKFDVNVVRIEIQGWHRMNPSMPLHWKTRKAQGEATPKLLEIQKAPRWNTRVPPRLVYQPSIENSIPEFHAGRSKRDDRAVAARYESRIRLVDLLVSRVKSMSARKSKSLCGTRIQSCVMYSYSILMEMARVKANMREEVV